MKFQVQQQFLPGNDKIWVARLKLEDPIFEYQYELEAEVKATELDQKEKKVKGKRKFRVTQI